MRWIAALLATVALGCTPSSLGGPCNDDPEAVYEDNAMIPQDGSNYIAQDPAVFVECETFLCLSSNGSKPYCTQRCVSDQECLGATRDGQPVDMVCATATEFGPLACRLPLNEHCAEGSPEDQLCCERDPGTNTVVDPASYCVAKDGQIAHDPKALSGGSS